MTINQRGPHFKAQALQVQTSSGHWPWGVVPGSPQLGYVSSSRQSHRCASCLLASSMFSSPGGGCILDPKCASDLPQGDQSPCEWGDDWGLVYTLQTTQTRHSQDSICLPCVSQLQSGHDRSDALHQKWRVKLRILQSCSDDPQVCVHYYFQILKKGIYIVA